MVAPRKSGPSESRERVARVLVDARTLGDRYAAKRHKVGVRTIERWRAKWADDDGVKALVEAYLEQVHEGWYESALALRLRLIEREAELIENRGTKLNDVTNALRRLNELIAAHELLHDVQPGHAHQSQRAREAQGSRTVEGPREGE